MTSKFVKKKIKGIEIDVRSKKSLYIKIDGWTVYIDNSTNEHIIDHWYDDTPTVHNRNILSKVINETVPHNYIREANNER